MALYFKDIEITNIDNLVPQSGLDITDIWFGSTNIYTVWQTYEGTLPATFNANGADMRQYQVYGAAGGVGDRTVQLFDISSAEPNKYINPNNGEVTTTLYNGYVLSDYIYVAGYNAVTIASLTGSVAKQTGAHINCYDNNKNWIRGYLAYNAEPANTQKKFVVDTTGISYIRVDFATADLSQNMLTPGTTPPETYVPFGYEVPIGVKSGNLFDKTVAIYHKYLSTDGSAVSSPVWGITDYINVIPNTEYIIKNAVGENPCYCIYDKDKNLILGEKYDNRQDVTFVTGSSAAYIRMSLVYDSGDGRYNLDDLKLCRNTTTPIYIGDDPLGKNEYIDYQKQKVYRRTVQVMPSAPAETKTSNGITVTCDGEGRYTISGTATDDVNIVFDIPDFTVPISVGQSGNGTISFFNNYIYSISGGSLLFLRNGETVFAWNFTTLNRTNNTYGSSIGGKTMNGLKFIVKSGDTVDGILSPMFTDNGILPDTYASYYQPTDPPVPLPALPTCDGTTIVDFAGSGTAPEKVMFKYQKEGF